MELELQLLSIFQPEDHFKKVKQTKIFFQVAYRQKKVNKSNFGFTLTIVHCYRTQSLSIAINEQITSLDCFPFAIMAITNP